MTSPRAILEFVGARLRAATATQQLAADVLLGAAALVLAAATWRAVALDPLPAAASPVAAGTPGIALAVRDAHAPADSGEIDNDPFREDRQLPEPASEEAPVAVAESTEPTLGPDMVRLIGTVVLPANRSFAIYQLPSQAPRTIRVGETVGGLRLEAIVPGQATFRAADGTRFELKLPKPGG